MKELNELVELAKEISSKQWFLNADEEVIAVDNDAGPDDSGEVFIGCAANIQLAKYISAASPETILVISEEFRAMEQGKTDAETVAENWKQETKIRNSQLDLAIEQRNQYQERAEAAEAKLAELEKQPSIATVISPPIYISHGDKKRVYGIETDCPLKSGDKLFASTGAASSLADLVPWELSLNEAHSVFKNYDCGDDIFTALMIGANYTRSVILRNIEETK